MNSKKIAAVGVLLILAGVGVTLWRGGILNGVFTAKAAQAPGGHEGHVTQPEGQAAPQEEEASAEAEAPTVEIPADKQQLIGVKTVEVVPVRLEKIIRTVGLIGYDERKITTVNTKFEGWIERLYIDYTGRYVKKGEALAEIYSPELLGTQQEFLNVFRWSKQSGGTKGGEISNMLSRDAQSIVSAARQRLSLWDISEAQIKQIEETGKPVRTLTMYSPVSGYVVQKMALQGMRVMPGEKLFDIADLSTVWVVSDVYESELPLIREGQQASISLSYFPNREFKARIDYVYPALSGETRSAKVRFTIPNPGLKLKPQMYTNVEIKIDLGKKLAVPGDAVIDTGVRQIVYVDKGEGYFEPREVTLGQQAEGYREILRGLNAGEKVASAATFLIDSEAQLKGVTPAPVHKH